MNLINKIGKMVKVNLPVNRLITFLTLSDFFVISGWGLINPIFAVYVTGQIKGAGLAEVGLASTIYLLLKSGLQVPLANIIDKIRGEKDDFLAMIIGSLLMSLTPLSYLFIRTVPQLFLAQAI